MTFDVFAKGLVDRFGQASPDRWRPRPDYEIATHNERDFREFLHELPTPPAIVGTKNDVREIGSKTFERRKRYPSGQVIYSAPQSQDMVCT